jgi:transposase
VCDTAPEPIRAQLRGLTTRRTVQVPARFRVRDPLTPTGGAKRALVAIARRWLALDTEIRDLKHASKQVLDAIATQRSNITVSATKLLCTAGDDPERLRTESSFAALCGTAPVPVSTGNSQRRRLNRAGDRRANSALWTIVMVRLRSRHAPTIAYLERRVSEGHSKRDAIRCLKRYVAREIYNDIQSITRANTTRPPLEIAA